MAEVLVLVEHAEGALKKVTAELITAARALGEPAAAADSRRANDADNAESILPTGGVE